MNFNEKKEQLLKEAYNLKENELFNDDFKRRFFNLIEDVILFLLDKNDDFFGQFMLRVRRNIRLDIKVPVATIFPPCSPAPGPISTI